ncbi:hypothetical protein ACWGN5_09070 [Streptomyces sp. NPDC055815]
MTRPSPWPAGSTTSSTGSRPTNASPCSTSSRPGRLGEGELLYRSCDFADGVSEATVTAAGEGTVELALTDGSLLSRVELAPTGGPYTCRTVTTRLDLTDVTDLRVRLGGPVRLAQIDFTAPAPSRRRPA